MVKLGILPHGKATHASYQLDVLYFLWRTTWAAWGPSAIIRAIATSDLRSLGLDMARCVVYYL